MIWYIVCTTFVLFFCIPSENRPSEVRVNLTQGIVIGSFDSYYKFYGIPYADSTAGINRFQPPKPSPLFRDPFVANRKNITCLRPTRDGYDGIEDCLSLNVVSPTVDHTRKLPVMVWIKGREINNFEPAFKNIIERDVVVVTPNFRESIFGFLCLGTSKAPGNAGLKDIIAALKWIQQNIAAFGGDPNNVTIFGHGSGASLVDLLTLSLSSKGLFHKAIAQSGTAMSPLAVTSDNLQNAIKVAEALGHRVEDVHSLSDIFTRVRASALMAVINELESDNLLSFAPCIERVISDDKEPFLLKSPYQILNSGEQLDVPFMTGFVDNEGPVVQKGLIKDWFSIVNLQKDLNFDTEEEKQKITEQIKGFYSLNNYIEKELYVTLAGDVMVHIPTLRESHIRAVTRTTPIYLYQFSYKGNLGNVFVEADYSKKSVHGQELAYLFYENSYEAWTAHDLAIADMLVERWTNFAKTG
ncbi:juvenile hormone esterase-like [Pieris napi]|uniref:juvenile hormone esterase-like n=1 Tax=Pieris napi TaxID=78633 RepID=UPI001FB94323|nr:juvenile hormone esterase-like [Pieris napi]